MQQQYRHEWKHEISYTDLLCIRQRLQAVAQPDPHAVGGQYRIRSLYFDDASDKALRQKIDGVNMREKFRIRYYNGDTSFIRLEKKSRRNGLGTKFEAALSAEEAQKIVDGDLDWMMESDRPLVQELYCKMRYQGLRPKTIVDYIREPYVYGPGNVRVTFDHDLRTGLSGTSHPPGGQVGRLSARDHPRCGLGAQPARRRLFQVRTVQNIRLTKETISNDIQ